MPVQTDFWSINQLKSKIGLWKPEQIQNIIIPLLELESNEFIYDIGSGFSPLGLSFIPYILPNGKIVGFDKDSEIVSHANQYAQENKLNDHILFKQTDVYDLDKIQLETSDLTMCQQLLVNLNDYTTAIENMIDVTKSSGRILCVENINYGAYIHRPDFSWRTNLRLSQIWQQLCLSGKFEAEKASTAMGAQLPQIFDELGLYSINYQILSPSSFPKPPYSEDFIRSFLKNHKEEKSHLKAIIQDHWNQGTDLSESDTKYFIEQVIDSDYDLYALKNNLYLTQWFYPLMVAVGWLSKKRKKFREEKLNLNIE